VIINASSFASVIPSVASGAYAASKAGVSSLTRTFAAELAPGNIRVVDYIPGVFDTPMNERAIETSRENLLRPIPLRRFGEARDLASAVVFLASDRAAYITGTSMMVSGGKFCVQNPQQAW
jgi:NAD(P)-dependent dehydrogenase (short-subunit alcohol dehydrogenase family)